MGKLVFAMNVSIDGYVAESDGSLTMPAPTPQHFAYWIKAVQDDGGAIYGRRMYEVMRYWDDDQPGWSEAEHRFAQAWRDLPKWVVSRTLSEVGPNAVLISTDVEAQVRHLKARSTGSLSIAGPEIAGVMSRAGLIDEYHLHVRPYVMGAGKPYFASALSGLRLTSHKQIDEEVVRLVYAHM